jgi:peptide/nickel transport system permease protein
MLTYILRRLLMTLPVLFGISLVTFSFMKITGDKGGPCAALLGERYTQARCEEIKERYGLDDHPVIQYQRYLQTTLSGDLGRSILTKRPVANELKNVLPATIELSAAAMLLAIVVGIPLGVIAAARHNTVFDLGAMVVALIGVSMPVFWLGLMMIYILAFTLGWFPTSGRLSSGIAIDNVTGMYVIDSLLAGDIKAFKDVLHHLALPALALSTIPSAIIARITRSAMLDALGQDYVRTARAKGLRELVVVGKHALANAMLPVVTVIGLQTGFLLSGAVLTETIFAWPGMGRWIVSAISANDTPVVQGGVLVFASIFVIINLLVDISYVWLDPRIRYG